jgi:hypothetical protein
MKHKFLIKFVVDLIFLVIAFIGYAIVESDNAGIRIINIIYICVVVFRYLYIIIHFLVINTTKLPEKVKEISVAVDTFLSLLVVIIPILIIYGAFLTLSEWFAASSSPEVINQLGSILPYSEFERIKAISKAISNLPANIRIVILCMLPIIVIAFIKEFFEYLLLLRDMALRKGKNSAKEGENGGLEC